MIVAPRVLKFDNKPPPFHLNYEVPIPYFKNHPLQLKVAPNPLSRLSMLQSREC